MLIGSTCTIKEDMNQNQSANTTAVYSAKEQIRDHVCAQRLTLLGRHLITEILLCSLKARQQHNMSQKSSHQSLLETQPQNFTQHHTNIRTLYTFMPHQSNAFGCHVVQMNTHTLTYCPLHLANTSWLRSQTLAKKYHCTTESMGKVCTKARQLSA